MKTKTLSFAIALSTFAFALSAQAHDPKEHMKDAENPDCSAMKNMDHSKMDMDDPVMQAMMKQCMQDMQHDEASESDGHADEEHEADTDGEESAEE
ncbi:MAG TPA: hypothetical protein PKK10_00805 [Woeseiaceae bacterium]|nr:hypothetical protein [Woeseiaceae bacterium]